METAPHPCMEEEAMCPNDGLCQGGDLTEESTKTATEQHATREYTCGFSVKQISQLYKLYRQEYNTVCQSQDFCVDLPHFKIDVEYLKANLSVMPSNLRKSINCSNLVGTELGWKTILKKIGGVIGWLLAFVLIIVGVAMAAGRASSQTAKANAEKNGGNNAFDVFKGIKANIIDLKKIYTSRKYYSMIYKRAKNFKSFQMFVQKGILQITGIDL